MTRRAAENPVDERLRELLAVEQRLQEAVAGAESAAARRISAARAGVSRARDEAARQDALSDEAERARDDEAHHAVLAGIEAAHQRAMAMLSNVDEPTVDRLARHVLARVLDPSGDAP